MKIKYDKGGYFVKTLKNKLKKEHVMFKYAMHTYHKNFPPYWDMKIVIFSDF